MESEDAVVLLRAFPAAAYREYLYRPNGRLARWIDDRFEVLAAPGRAVRRAPRAGDLLIEVALGRAGHGRCVALTPAQLAEPGLARGPFTPGRLLLRPRGRAEVSEPLPVEPTVAEADRLRKDPPSGEFPVHEHDFGDAAEPGTPVRRDTAAAVVPFGEAERARVADSLLSARASAKAVAWTRRTHSAVSGVTVEEIRAALRDYVDPAAVQLALDRRNKRQPGEAVDASSPDTDAVLVECVHQFQIKCYCDRREHDGQAGESTLDSLGLIVRSGSGFRGADRGNAAALKRLHAVDDKTSLASLTSNEFTPASWFDAMTDPSVFGWRTKHGHGLHVLLVRRLRKAERHLLSLPAYRGMTPAALGTTLELKEPHGGARPGASTGSVHTFGLALDIAFKANPWIHRPTSWQAVRHAALLISGTRLEHKSAPEYFSQLGAARDRSTERIWEEVRRRSDELIAYFALGQDTTKLRAALESGQSNGTAGLVSQGQSLDQATATWRTRIEQDRSSLGQKDSDFCGHEPPARGFLTLSRDLVVALRDHACLAWGAVDLGPGARGSGDMMHFDARIGGVGEALARGVNFVPATGHPCLPAPARPADAEAAPAGAPETTGHLGGKLWTFVSATTALPVAVFCPERALSGQSVEVLVFAHGLLHGCPLPGQVPAGFVTHRPFALGAPVHASGRPLVLAVPLLDWAHPGGEHAFGRGFERRHALGRPERLNRLVDEVLDQVGRVRGTASPALTNLLLAGHSRAYDLLEPLAESRRDPAMRQGALAELTGVWAFDTAYAGSVGTWTGWLEADPDLQVHCFYRPGSRTADVGDRFHRGQRPRLTVTRVSEPHCEVPAVRLPGLLGPAPGPTDAEAATVSPVSSPTAEELTLRIARCIGVWETNRGRDYPLPRESTLDTVAGVHASMATIEQATMPYAITVLRRHKALRDRARPSLTLKELNAAGARVTAVAGLLALVATAWGPGIAPDPFVAAHRRDITATGLADDDVRTMFRAEALRAALGRVRKEAEVAGQAAADKAARENRSAKEQEASALAARRACLTASLAALSAADRLGLGEASLRAYAERPALWGENRAGWQRRAVAAMPDDVGRRIEAVAVSENGTALVIPTVRGRVIAQLATSPAPATETVVRAVAQQNNPHEPEYGLHVWQTYQRLYP